MREELCVAGRLSERRAAERGVDHVVNAAFAADDGVVIDERKGDAAGRALKGDAAIARRVRPGELGLRVEKGARLGGIGGVEHDRSLRAGG